MHAVQAFTGLLKLYWSPDQGTFALSSSVNEANVCSIHYRYNEIHDDVHSWKII